MIGRSYLRRRCGGRFHTFLFRYARKVGPVRRQLEHGPGDHQRPLRRDQHRHGRQRRPYFRDESQTKINGVAGPRQAKGTGKFTKVKGVGKWNGTGPSGVCA